MFGRDCDQNGSALNIYLPWYAASCRNIGVLKNTVVFLTPPSGSSVSHTTSSRLAFPGYIVPGYIVGVGWYRLGSHAYFGGRSTEQ